MRFLLIILAFTLFQPVFSQAPAPVPAANVISEAMQIAVKENKKVFVIFHASWCVWCHKMDTSMNDESIKKFFEDNFVIRHLVVDESKNNKLLENPGASDLRDKHYGKDQGIPFWLVFDSKGELLADSKVRNAGEGLEKGENVGCPATEKEVAYFINVLKKTTSLKPAELEIIRQRFRKNEMK